MNIDILKNRILSALKIRGSIAGIEISDNILRYAMFDGKKWIFTGIRIPPGIIVNGEVKNYGQFVDALKSLRTKIFGGRNKKKKIGVSVSIGSVDIYTQIFSLPMIRGENLEKAIQLNIRMISPKRSSETYAGWQLVGRNQKSLRVEVLSAFIERSTVDKIRKALEETNFIVHSVEPRAMSLTRLLREKAVGFNGKKSYIVVSLDSNGLEIFIIRNGNFYFQYFKPWSEIFGGRIQVSKDTFESSIIYNFRQVLNFYNSHWSDPLAGVFLSTPEFKQRIAKILSDNFGVKVFDIALKDNMDVSPNWFVALGSGLRGLSTGRRDTDISLLGVSAQEEIRRQQIITFASFWRVVVPISMLLLASSFILADIFISDLKNNLDKQISEMMLTKQGKEIGKLSEKANEFNNLLELIAYAEKISNKKFAIVNDIYNIMKNNNILLDGFLYQGEKSPVVIRGFAESQSDILNFKKELGNDSRFSSIDLPFTNIKVADGGYSFTVKLNITSFKGK